VNLQTAKPGDWVLVDGPRATGVDGDLERYPAELVSKNGRSVVVRRLSGRQRPERTISSYLIVNLYRKSKASRA
jgi:hypothetical protein